MKLYLCLFLIFLPCSKSYCETTYDVEEWNATYRRLEALPDEKVKDALQSTTEHEARAAKLILKIRNIRTQRSRFQAELENASYTELLASLASENRFEASVAGSKLSRYHKDKASEFIPFLVQYANSKKHFRVYAMQLETLTSEQFYTRMDGPSKEKILAAINDWWAKNRDNFEQKTVESEREKSADADSPVLHP